jgi:hypothetical protein
VHQPFLPCALVLPETNTASGCCCWACQAFESLSLLAHVELGASLISIWKPTLDVKHDGETPLAVCPRLGASPFPTFPSYSRPQALGHDRSGPANDRVAGCGSRPRWNITHQYIHLTLDFLRHLRKLVCESSADTWTRIGGNTNHPRRVDHTQVPSLMTTASPRHGHEAIV